MVIGASGATLDYLLFLLLFNVFKIDPLYATVLSVTGGIVNNFFWNAKFNFKVTNHLLKRFASFYLVGLTGIVLSIVFIHTLHNILHIDANIAKLISIPIIVILQYGLNRKISFGDDPAVTLRLMVASYAKYIKKNHLVISFILLAALLFVYGIRTSIIGTFPDEDDNILGGLLINQGGAPYVSFFSHHAPLMYYVTAFITMFAHNDLGQVRALFFVFIFLLNVAIAVFAYRNINRVGALLFLALTVIYSPLIWTNLLLAEAVIAPLVLGSLLVATYRRPQSLIPTGLTLTLIAIAAGLLNPIYTPIFALIIALFLFNNRALLRKSIGSRQRIGVGVLAVLGVTSLGSLYRVGFIQSFYRDFIVFNSQYYASFNGEAGTVENALFLPINFIKTISTVPWSVDQLMSIKLALLFGWIITLVFFFYKKQYFTAAVIFLICAFTQIRGWSYLTDITGTIPALTGGHHRILWNYLSLGLLAIFTPALITLFARLPRKESGFTLLRFVLYSIITVVLFFGVKDLAVAARTGWVAAKAQSLDTVITNRSFINDTKKRLAPLQAEDKVWAAPLHFDAYLDDPSRSPSDYYFFLPWQAKCRECVENVVGDLKANKPSVIIWSGNMSVWGYSAHDFGSDIEQRILNTYVQSDSPILKDYYFIDEKTKELVEDTL